MQNITTQFTNPKAYKKFAIGLFSFLISYTVASTFAPVANSSATDISDTKTQNFSVTVANPYYINITSAHASASEPISLDYGADGNTIGNVIATSDTVTTETNSPLTHYLYLSTTSNSNSLSSSDEHNSDTISAGGGDDLASAAALGDNTWGFALPSTTSGLPTNTFDADYASVSNSSKFTKVPTSGNEVLIQQETGSGNRRDMDVTTSTANIYYGAKAATDLPAGTYANIVRYTAYAEEPDISIMIDDFEYMQDLTEEACTNTPLADTSGNNVFTLKDRRDEKSYRIAHLKDGNCWMVQNLALDGGRKLTPADSNITNDYTLPDNSAIGTAIDQTTQLVMTNPKDSSQNLYNWYSATAGVGKYETLTIVTESICPAGWMLPNGIGSKSIKNLTDTYGYTQGSNPEAVVATQKAPFYMTPTGTYGYYNDTWSYVEPDVFSAFLTRQPSNFNDSSWYIYRADIYGANFSTWYAPDYLFAPAGSGGTKDAGAAVRCVLGS